jgi:hypothetical protein
MLHPVLQKPLALSIALCLGLSGCQVFDKSETWETVMKVRPGQSVRDPDPSHAYAARLHDALADRGVEHKVITYQYRYTTRLREEAVGTRTAVVYRDASSGTHQWWIKDDRLNKPVWLPNGELNRQVSFYLRRKAEVIEKKNYPAKGGSSKAMLAFAKPAQSLRRAAQAPERAVTRITPVKKAPAPVIAKKPVPTPKPVVKVKPAPVKIAVKRAPAPKPAPVARETEALAPIASRSTSTWNPPSVLDRAQQPPETAPRDRYLEKLFRSRHGSEYNVFSVSDRRKMAELQESESGGGE